MKGLTYIALLLIFLTALEYGVGRAENGTGAGGASAPSDQTKTSTDAETETGPAG